MLSDGFGLGFSNNPSVANFSLPSIHTVGTPVYSTKEQSYSSACDNSRHVSDGPRFDESRLNIGTPHTPRVSQELQVSLSNEDACDDEKNLQATVRGGRWSFNEHERFLAGFRAYGHKWKRVQQVVRTRSVTQVRTHAQKYLLKLAKIRKEKQSSTIDTPTGEEKKSLSQDGTKRSSSSFRTPQVTSTWSSVRENALLKSPASASYLNSNIEALTDVDKRYIAAAAATLCNLMRQSNEYIKDERTNSVCLDAFSHLNQFSQTI
uniref:Uncharacterized protein AlNc14C5G709 n=1 Tax=Albugo laibachii Nc14 TaxID=890382 RepID=F0W0S4_9STRA|nr:conserved hypothetical protein [Albugo laibachii Nc14]|eukprot:CCA14648.1 conserved hypothetical protein [Albugo laibachii Nc14]